MRKKGQMATMPNGMTTRSGEVQELPDDAPDIRHILQAACDAVSAENATEGVKLSGPDPDWFEIFVYEVMTRLDAALEEDGAECPCCGIPT